MNKRSARTKGRIITRTANIGLPKNGANDDGEVIPVGDRFRFLAMIVNKSAQTLLDQVWAYKRVHEISEQNASHAWVACERAYRDLDLDLSRVHVSSRVKRLIFERAGRVLRTKAHQLSLAEAVLCGERGEYERSEWRNMVRSVRKQDTRDPYVIVREPELHSQIVNLDAIDKQQAEIHGTSLRVLLPTVPFPSRKDWEWCWVSLELGDRRAAKFDGWLYLKPTVRINKSTEVLQVPLETDAPPVMDGSERVLALDWGVRRLLTGAVLWRDGDVIRTDGRPYFYQAAGALLNLERTRAHARMSVAKAKRVNSLLEGRPDTHLQSRLEVHQSEADRQWAHVRELNKQLACHAANWAIDQAISVGADTIAIEDLRSLEARNLGRVTNERVSQSVRGKIRDRLADRCQEQGIKLITVNPRGTSKHCSRCSRAANHWHSPSKRSGRANWVVCDCGRSSDRDHSAAERIGSRALDKTTPNVRITRSRKPRPLPPLDFFTPGKRSSKRSSCPRSVHRALTPERKHHVSQRNPRVRPVSEARLDAFRHHVRASRVRDDHSIKPLTPLTFQQNART